MPNENVDSGNAKVGKERILALPVEELTKEFLESLFANYHDKATNSFKKSQFEPGMKIGLTQKEYPYLKEANVTTTLGRLVFNRYVLEKAGVINRTGYYNVAIDKKGIGKLDSILVELVINDKVTMDEYINYIDSRDRLGFWTAAFLSTSLSSRLLLPMQDVEKRKAELLKQHSKELNSQSPVVQTVAMNAIEKELMGMVRKNLESDSGYDLYRSGDGNLDNNYKTINVMRGQVFNEVTKRYDIVGSSLMNGIKKQDIPAFSNSVLAGAYPSAVGTAESGYQGKILMAVMQNETLDPDPKSDCKTKMTIPVTITKKNKSYFLYRNFNINGKIVESNPENIDSMIGKTMKMYSPQCCLHSKLCAKCMGSIFYRMGVENVGLLTSDITDALLNLKLKAKHDLSQKAGAVPGNYIFGKDNQYYTIDKEGYLVNKARMRAYVPRMFDDFHGFYIEQSSFESMGIFPVKFFDKNDKEIFSTSMIIPCMVNFNIYSDVQETPEHYIITYEPGSVVCSTNIQKTFLNCEFFIDQIFLKSSTPQLPYHLMVEFMWRCLELNDTNLNGISAVYEMLARAVCKHNGKPFAFEYGKGGVDPMSYEKLRFREAVQKSGVLQGILFEDISTALGTGLSQTLNGIEPTPSPLEQVIKA